MHADNCLVWLGLEQLFSPPILLFADSIWYDPWDSENFPRDTSTDATASRTAFEDVSPDIAKPCAPRLGPRSRPTAALDRPRSHGEMERLADLGVRCSG